MKQKKAIIPLLSILTFATVLTACGATAASGPTPHLANSDAPPTQVMSASNTTSKTFDRGSTEQLASTNNAVTPTSNGNENESDVVQDVIPSGEGYNPLEFWEISEYENWMKTEREKNQKLADRHDKSFYYKGENGDYDCREWTQDDVDMLYAQWQEQLALMKQGYQFTKPASYADDGLTSGVFGPEANEPPVSAPGSTIITMPDKSTIDLGHFDTSDEAVKAVANFLKKQVEQGNLTQNQADAILANGALE